MLNKFLSAFSYFKNIENIRATLNASYVALVRTLATLVFIQSQVNDTKLGKTVSEYLPKTIEVLEKLKELFEKYGKYIGLDVGAAVAQGIINEESLSRELDKSIKELNAIS